MFRRAAFRTQSAALPKNQLSTGPVFLQETKWDGNQHEVVFQHIAGVQNASTAAISTCNERCSGGAAILLPAGWTIGEKFILLKGRAVAALVQDRSCPFYLISVYLHPDHVKKELDEVLNVWRELKRKVMKLL